MDDPQPLNGIPPYGIIATKVKSPVRASLDCLDARGLMFRVSASCNSQEGSMKDTCSQPVDPGRFVGSAVVIGASNGAEATLLKLRTFSGECLDYEVRDIPDHAGAAELGARKFRPIPVKIQDGGQRCGVIALTSSGTRHSPISLGTALALQQSGVLVVVDGGLQAWASCSSQGSRIRPRQAGAPGCDPSQPYNYATDP
jgi:hypothetical protein